jgi:hypothetical protein
MAPVKIFILKMENAQFVITSEEANVSGVSYSKVSGQRTATIIIYIFNVQLITNYGILEAIISKVTQYFIWSELEIKQGY